MCDSLDSFVFDITLFDTPNSDYVDPGLTSTNRDFSTSSMVNYSLYALELYNIMKDTYILNKYEIKGLIMEYVSLRMYIPKSKIYNERISIGRLLKFIDKIINIYLKLQGSPMKSKDRLQEFIKHICLDLHEAEVVISYC